MSIIKFKFSCFDFGFIFEISDISIFNLKKIRGPIWNPSDLVRVFIFWVFFRVGIWIYNSGLDLDTAISDVIAILIYKIQWHQIMFIYQIRRPDSLRVNYLLGIGPINSEDSMEPFVDGCFLLYLSPSVSLMLVASWRKDTK